jgi:lysophospholipase L1-like esterase
VRPPLRRLAATVAVAALACAGTVAASGPARASGSTGSTGRYLALGDSVPFGFSPLVPSPSPPSRYVGYPELIGRSTGLTVTNLSCPGQASGGMNSPYGADNGCFSFRRKAHLHVDYTGTQTAAAVAFLRRHPDTRAVTVMLGGNDLFLCQDKPNSCDLTEFQASLDAYRANLAVTFAALRKVYAGKIVVVGYYSTDYTDSLTTLAVQVFNFWASWTVGLYGGTYADGFTVFQDAAAAAGGDTCKAGLLIVKPSGACDVHLSRKGARLMARTVRAAIGV